MKQDATCKCGHSWVDHFGFNPAKTNKHRAYERDGRKQPCEREGCKCKDWKEKEAENG